MGEHVVKTVPNVFHGVMCFAVFHIPLFPECGCSISFSKFLLRLVTHVNVCCSSVIPGNYVFFCIPHFSVPQLLVHVFHFQCFCWDFLDAWCRKCCAVVLIAYQPI